MASNGLPDDVNRPASAHAFEPRSSPPPTRSGRECSEALTDSKIGFSALNVLAGKSFGVPVTKGVATGSEVSSPADGAARRDAWNGTARTGIRLFDVRPAPTTIGLCSAYGYGG